MPDRDDVWNQTDEASPYTDEARALVELASIARELSDASRTFVAAGGQPQVSLIEKASRTVTGAERLLSAAVVACRAAGISWKDIGESLGVTKQTAQGRFTGAVNQWTDAPATDWFARAAELDAWIPFSGGLRRMGPFEEQLEISDRRRRLLEGHIFPAAQLAPLYDREAVLYDRLAAGGVDVATNMAAADRARRRAQECREHLAKEYPPLTIETANGPRIAATWESDAGKYRCPVCPALSATTSEAIRHAETGHELPVPPGF
ncbi:hypothetical protein AB0M02_41805 [Actinoplanes sp. NPDC051861]|uniref:hypothetical protein n=1 Tax=Actinoplanes sp. NPDC051861 TaxID=3155170 RepID=UPI003415CC0E